MEQGMNKEELMLGLPLSQWMEMVLVLESSDSLETWNEISEKLKTIRTKDDIRYDYFDMHEANLMIKKQLQAGTLEAAGQLLRFFAESNLRYARKVYRPQTFESAPDVMDETIRVAILVEKAFSEDLQDMKKHLADLGQAVEIWPVLGSCVKTYAQLLGQKEEQKAKEANAANDQLQAMAIEVKKQLFVLMENKMYAEAYSVVQQLRRMLPQDEELMSLEEEIVQTNNNILLSIAVLVSNRRDTIRKCLDSLTPIREAIPCELILLDTGCDPDVRAILEEYGDTVAEFTWCNDFSKARNATLPYAHGEWYLYLDDDEWFVDTKDIIDFFKNGDYKKYGYASYIQRNFLDMEMTQYTDAWVSRMSRRWQNLHFESRIHEYMEPMEGDCIGLKSIVHHFGYVFETEEALRKHYERNRVLLLEMMEEEPDNLRWRIQLAQEYRSVKESRLLYELGEESLALTKDRTEMYDCISIGGFYGAKILALKEEKRYEEMQKVCLEADADSRMTELCSTFTSLREADACFYLERYAECEMYAKRYVRWKEFWDENEPLLFLQKAVPFVGECLDLVRIKEGYSLLICAGLKQGNTQYLKEYLPQLCWDESSLYVHEEIVQTMIEAMCRLPREEIFENLIQLMHGHGPLWEYFCQQLVAYEEAGHRVTSVMEIIRDVAPDALQESAAQTAAPEKQIEKTGEGMDHANSSEDASEDIQSGYSKEPSQEMQELASGIKDQLRLLIQNGMKSQALEVMSQVRRMLPEDQELEELEKKLQM